jgi:paraquat-inducible protein B
MKVGSVRSLALAKTAQTVEVVVVIDAEYKGLVRANTKFWNAGGIGFDWGLMRGLTVKAGSLESLMAGAIAFATPTKAGEPAANGQKFVLADTPKDEWLTWAPEIGVGER